MVGFSWDLLANPFSPGFRVFPGKVRGTDLARETESPLGNPVSRGGGVWPVFGGRRKRRVALNPKAPLGGWPVSGGRKNRVALNPKVPLGVWGGYGQFPVDANRRVPLHPKVPPVGGGVWPVCGGRRKRRADLNPKVPLGVWPVSYPGNRNARLGSPAETRAGMSS